MKSLRVFALLILGLLFAAAAMSQTLTPKPGVQLAPGVGGYYEYLPKGYDGVKKFPVLIFFHGLGQQGDGKAQLGSLASAGSGLIAMISSGAVPDQGMIVIAPQYIGWPAPDQSLQVLNKVLELYPSADTNRIYLTGLSMGGGATWELAALAGKRIAAIAPLCGASSPTQERILALVKAGTPIFAFHGDKDGTVTVNNTHGYVDGVNANGITPKAIKYIYAGGGHNIWGDAYLPYQGIYDFLKKYNRGVTDTSTPVTPAPTPVNPSTIRISASERPPTGWVSDAAFVANVTRGFWGGVESIWGAGQTRVISGTTEQKLYSLERWGQFDYNVPVPNGDYTIKLHFVELWLTTVGRRVFNVDIEGKRVLSNFDMLSIAPRFTAIERSFPVSVVDGMVNIKFTNVSSDSKITAVEIIPSGTVATPTPTPYQKVFTIEYRDSATNNLIRSQVDTFRTPTKVIVKESN